MDRRWENQRYENDLIYFRKCHVCYREWGYYDEAFKQPETIIAEDTASGNYCPLCMIVKKLTDRVIVLENKLKQLEN